MKMTKIETLNCDAGWRYWSFVKICTDAGITGYSECTESFGSPQGIAGCIKDLTPQLIGEDPRATEALYWKMYRIARQSPGGIMQKAIGGVENALLDIKAKALGIPIYELFGGPMRNEIRAYWSHCGTTRIRSNQFVNAAPINTLDDIAELGKEVAGKGFTALKTNILLPGKPFQVLMQGYNGGPGTTDQNANRDVIEGLDAVIGAFREGAGPKVDVCLDVNFNFKIEGNKKVAKALEKHNLLWYELDNYNPHAVLEVKKSTQTPICSCEDLYTNKSYRPYFEMYSMDIASIDVLWNGLVQSKKIADMAEVYDMNVSPHNHYSHFATMMSAQFCAAVPNARILEIDVDDVPWKNEIVTKIPEIKDGYMKIPAGPGWGIELNEEVIKQHPCKLNK